jgi:hypothetical protein
MPSTSHQAPNEGYFDFLDSQTVNAIANDNAAATPSQNALFSLAFYGAYPAIPFEKAKVMSLTLPSEKNATYCWYPV